MDNFADRTVVNAPPPPPLEIKIRTMRSDIDSMMKSGGGAPIFQDVAVSGLSMEKEYRPPTFMAAPMPVAASKAPAAERSVAPLATPTSAPDAPAEVQIEEQKFQAAPAAAQAFQPVVGDEVSAGSDLLPKIIVGLVALIAIGVVGYFAYTIFK